MDRAKLIGVYITDETPLNDECQVQPHPRRRLEGDSPYDQQAPSKSVNLNLDVLALISNYIQPIDLLNLARTCKSLRTLLMQSSSTFVWKTTRKNVRPENFPDCPADLSEPQYAELVFGTTCDGCGETTQTVFWRIRRRYCSECLRQRFHRLAFCDDIIRSADTVPVEWFTIDDDAGYWVDVDQMTTFLSEFSKLSNKEAFLNDACKRYTTMHQHAILCEYWERKIRYQREQSILERLEECGYGYEGWPVLPLRDSESVMELQDLYPSAFGGQKLLTDEEWDDMSARWKDIMSDRKKRKVEEWQKDLCRAFQTPYR